MRRKSHHIPLTLRVAIAALLLLAAATAFPTLSGANARAKLAAGADLVQVYTGLIYRGPALVSECAAALARG